MQAGGAATVARVIAAMRSMPMKSWELGVAGQALAAWGDWEGARELAHEAVRRQGSDGRLGLWDQGDSGSTDPACCGLAALQVGRHFEDKALLDAADRMAGYLATQAPRAPDGCLYHLTGKPEVWIDSLYMAPPFLAALGRWDDALLQVQGIYKRLWDPAARLFHHIHDDGVGALKRADQWGVGNGWAAAGLAALIRAAEPGSARDALAGQARSLLEGCLAWLRPDGLFHDVVDQPATFVETNLSQMLAAVIFNGIRDAWLGRDWLVKGEMLRLAALAKVDEVGWVQGVCGAPNFDAPGTAVEGQAFCIFMEAAWNGLGAESY